MNLLSRFSRLSFVWQKFFFMLAIAIFFVASYSLLGQFYLGEAQPLPYTFVDKSLPFLAWTFWIYISDYAFLVLAGFLMPDYEHLFRFGKAFFITIFFHFGIFFVCPTYTCRVEITGQDISSLLGRIVYSLDEITNCFPSLHVSLTFLAAFVVIKSYRFLLVPFLVWAVAIAISTITTRQHYFYDVISGTIVSIVVFILCYSKFSLKTAYVSRSGEIV